MRRKIALVANYGNSPVDPNIVEWAARLACAERQELVVVWIPPFTSSILAAWDQPVALGQLVLGDEPRQSHYWQAVEAELGPEGSTWRSLRRVGSPVAVLSELVEDLDVETLYVPAPSKLAHLLGQSVPQRLSRRFPALVLKTVPPRHS